MLLRLCDRTGISAGAFACRAALKSLTRGPLGIQIGTLCVSI